MKNLLIFTLSLLLAAPAYADLNDIIFLQEGAGGTFVEKNLRLNEADFVAELSTVTTDTELTTTLSGYAAKNEALDFSGAYLRFQSFDVLDASDLGSVVQGWDADLDDLADGSLSGNKVGTGISGTFITGGTVDEAYIDADIARDTEVSSTYLPLAGGTITGDLYFGGSVFIDQFGANFRIRDNTAVLDVINYDEAVSEIVFLNQVKMTTAGGVAIGQEKAWFQPSGNNIQIVDALGLVLMQNDSTSATDDLYILDSNLTFQQNQTILFGADSVRIGNQGTANWSIYDTGSGSKMMDFDHIGSVVNFFDSNFTMGAGGDFAATTSVGIASTSTSMSSGQINVGTGGTVYTDNITAEGTSIAVNSPLNFSDRQNLSASATVTADTDTLNVANLSVVIVNPNIANVVIGGFTGGVTGQLLRVVVPIDGALTTTLEHDENVGGATQDILLSSAPSDETIAATAAGGWTLYFDGTNWIEIDN